MEDAERGSHCLEYPRDRVCASRSERGAHAAARQAVSTPSRQVGRQRKWWFAGISTVVSMRVRSGNAASGRLLAAPRAPGSTPPGGLT